MGVREIFVEDLRETFVADYVFPMFRANALYEGVYPLGTSIARPLIAERQIAIARAVGADAVAHGATGKGNDQVRFELAYYALDPDIRVIAPGANGTSIRGPGSSPGPKRTRSPSRPTSAAKRPIRPTPTCSTSPMRARFWKTPGLPRRGHVHAHRRPRGGARPRDGNRPRFRGRRSGERERRTADAGGAARAPQRRRRRERNRPRRCRGEPLCRHEIAAASTKPRGGLRSSSRGGRWRASPSTARPSTSRTS